MQKARSESDTCQPEQKRAPHREGAEAPPVDRSKITGKKNAPPHNILRFFKCIPFTFHHSNVLGGKKKQLERFQKTKTIGIHCLLIRIIQVICARLLTSKHSLSTASIHSFMLALVGPLNEADGSFKFRAFWQKEVPLCCDLKNGMIGLPLRSRKSIGMVPRSSAPLLWCPRATWERNCT